MAKNKHKKAQAKKQKQSAKKSTAKKIVAKKAAVKKPIVKKAAAKKIVARKPLIKVVAKKTVTRKPAVKKPVAQKVAPQKPAVQPQAVQKPAAQKFAVQKTAAPKAAYKVGHYVVYPTHGVGRIMAEETQMIGEIELRMLVISFEKDKMTLRVPVHRAGAAGLRPVSSTDQMKKVFNTLRSRARTSRGMWSRRAQEYEAKINSGNIFFIAEVVRDLHQNVDQSERSYSERMIYESALSRLVGELAAAEAISHETATDKLMKLLRAKVAANAAAAVAAAEVAKEAA